MISEEQTEATELLTAEIHEEPELPGLEDAPALKEPKKWFQNKIFREVLSWTATVLLAMLIAVFINAYVFRSSKVDGRSMLPTLTEGQSVYISRLPYWFGNPKYGDIIVFDSENVNRNFFLEVKESFQYNIVTYGLFRVNHPQKYWIKRIIGLPGDTIEVREDGVYRNGEQLEEPYVYSAEVLEYGNWDGQTWTVGKNQLFVMGDNRNHSMDSRDIGLISQDAVLGKVVKR